MKNMRNLCPRCTDIDSPACPKLRELRENPVQSGPFSHPLQLQASSSPASAKLQLAPHSATSSNVPRKATAGISRLPRVHAALVSQARALGHACLIPFRWPLAVRFVSLGPALFAALDDYVSLCQGIRLLAVLWSHLRASAVELSRGQAQANEDSNTLGHTKTLGGVLSGIDLLSEPCSLVQSSGVSPPLLEVESPAAPMVACHMGTGARDMRFTGSGGKLLGPQALPLLIRLKSSCKDTVGAPDETEKTETPVVWSSWLWLAFSQLRAEVRCKST